MWSGDRRLSWCFCVDDIWFCSLERLIRGYLSKGPGAYICRFCTGHVRLLIDVMLISHVPCLYALFLLILAHSAFQFAT